jgi:STE24 endopeptidase
MSGLNFLTGSIGFSLLMFAFKLYVEYRQLQRNKSERLPTELKSFFDKNTFSKAQKYNYAKRSFSILSGLTQFIFELFMLVWVSPKIWKWIGNYSDSYKSVIFILACHQISNILTIPLSLYKDFVIEAAHGFNKKTKMLFVTDFIKSELLMVVFTSLLVPVLVAVADWSGDNLPFYVWVLTQVMILVMTFIYPTLIQPLFNKFEPLKNEQLRAKIEKLAAEHDFPLTRLYQVDGSTRSAHSNAYFYGFGSSKRIVLYDTLLNIPDNEILGVLCHEIGHWYHSHMLINRIYLSIYMLSMFYSYHFFIHWYGLQLVGDFGFGLLKGDKISFIIGLMLFQRIYAPIEEILSFIMIYLSRVFEFQADRFAATAGRSNDLIEALKKLQKDNLGEMDPDWLYSMINFTHPPLLERIRALKSIKQEKTKKQQ